MDRSIFSVCVKILKGGRIFCLSDLPVAIPPPPVHQLGEASHQDRPVTFQRGVTINNGL